MGISMQSQKMPIATTTGRLNSIPFPILSSSGIIFHIYRSAIAVLISNQNLFIMKNPKKNQDEQQKQDPKQGPNQKKGQQDQNQQDRAEYKEGEKSDFQDGLGVENDQQQYDQKLKGKEGKGRSIEGEQDEQIEGADDTQDIE